ncbi:hypothetical protein [Desulfosarcina sp.]|uniref:hypothetical protein n=1 Tax=Desulfosarcina sp. TaxID=2027861 RepID=UPI00356237CE
MDTDDLSEKAYSIIVHAARVCDTLKAELGALSLECENEDMWLRRVQSHLRKIVEDPDEYVEYWNLEEEDGINVSQIKKLALDLSRQVNETRSPFMNT